MRAHVHRRIRLVRKENCPFFLACLSLLSLSLSLFRAWFALHMFGARLLLLLLPPLPSFPLRWKRHR